MAEVIELTDLNFDNKVKWTTVPVVAYFYRNTCPHCKKQTPVYESFAKARDSKFRFVKVNLAKHRKKADWYGVRGVPCFLLFKNGQHFNTVNGFQEKSELTAMLKKFL